jgi:hypothetical protein
MNEKAHKTEWIDGWIAYPVGHKACCDLAPYMLHGMSSWNEQQD